MATNLANLVHEYKQDTYIDFIYGIYTHFFLAVTSHTSEHNSVTLKMEAARPSETSE
jgi:hypothetical protein